LGWKDIRKPGLLDKLLKLLAYYVGSEVSLHELGKQLNVKSQTVETYIDILEKSFVIFRLTPYSSNPRKEVVKMSKIYFWDNGIRNAVIHQFSPLPERNDLGQLWENFMISERLKSNHYAKSDAKSYFWRSLNQSEVDYVEVDGDKIHAYEFKWGSQTRFSRAFLNFYPHAQTAIIQPQNFVDFCRV
jgi:predicted AAA+ superfamily ATPase